MAVTAVTDTDFDSKVLQNKTPVLVDFWASWCVAPETKVLTASGSFLPAKKISNFQKVTSFSSSGPRISNVSHSKVVSDEGHCKKIVTESARTIKLTDDHLLLTTKGWRQASTLKRGDLVAAYPHPTSYSHFANKNKTLVDENAIRAQASKSMRVEKYIKELNKRELLPLRMNSEKLVVLTRILGFIFSDGSLYRGIKNNYREISFTLGRKEDVEMLKTDLSFLGFPLVHVKYRETTNEIGGRHFVAKCFKVKSLSTALWLLLKSLGAPLANKTLKPLAVPKWIFESSKAVKQTFLAGYLGGDGPKPAIRIVPRKRGAPYNNIHLNDLEFHKVKSLKDNALVFAKDIKTLLEEFGVVVKDIFVEEEKCYLRKDGMKTIIIHIKFASSVDSVYSYSDIGFAYSFTKQTQAGLVKEFLGRIKRRRESWRQLYMRANELFAKGKSIKDISRKLKLEYDFLWSWLKGGKKPTTPHHFEKFDLWNADVTKGLPGGFIWDRVKAVSGTFLPSVSRITVEEAHNFVANGLVVHNCGPCKLAEPVLEELSEEYKGKVEIAKLDVDANQQTSMKHGVMSIPTTILFKNGKEVGRQVGFAGKKAFEDLISKVL